jgi:hypothetical protein
VDKPIAQTASRTRVNVMGAIELASMNVISRHPDYVNAETTVAFFERLKTAYPSTEKYILSWINWVTIEANWSKIRLYI